MASMGLNLDEQKAVDRFRAAVVEPSRSKLVILDFWAEWCGPCKALAPLLEKVAADYADKGVVLAKLNVDEEPFIAAQFQVRSIPTVYAIFQGQPIADLTSARTESQLKQMLDQLLEKLPVDSSDAQAQADIAQLAFAQAAFAAGLRDEAADTLLHMIGAEPEWNEGAAKAKLLQIFEAVGLEDPWVSAQRRKLSLLLFG